MMEDIHIPDGIAVKLLLAGLVVASAAVGALGLAYGGSQVAADGSAESSSAQLAFPIDNATNAFPINNVTMAFPIDNASAAFPIDNVSVSGPTWDVADASQLRGTEAGSDGVNVLAFARQDVPDELPQDMDPY